MKQIVSCILHTAFQTDQLVGALKRAGFRSTRISVLMPNILKLHELSQASTEFCVAISEIGASLGWLAGIEIMTIPGLGPIIAAGPIVAALCDAPGGNLNGELAGILISLGISENDAIHFISKLREGKIILFVHAFDDEESELVVAVFKSETTNNSGVLAIRT